MYVLNYKMLATHFPKTPLKTFCVYVCAPGHIYSLIVFEVMNTMTAAHYKEQTVVLLMLVNLQFLLGTLLDYGINEIC